MMPGGPLVLLLCLFLVRFEGAANSQAPRGGPAAPSESPAGALKQASNALDAGETERALRLVAPLIKQHPGNVKARLLAARAHLAREEYAAAHDHLRRALAADSRNVDVLYYLGIVTSELAGREFNRLHELAPDGARAHLLMAESLVLQQNPLEAAAEYELALRAAPDLLEALIGLGELRREQADCAGAIAVYERAEAVTSTYDAAYGLGMCFAFQNDHARAIKHFRSAIALNAGVAAAHFALGSSLLRMGDTAAAVTALQRAVALEPRLRQGHYLLGRAYRLIGKNELARQAFARADELMQDERALDEKVLGGQPRIIRPRDPR